MARTKKRLVSDVLEEFEFNLFQCTDHELAWLKNQIESEVHNRLTDDKLVALLNEAFTKGGN